MASRWHRSPAAGLLAVLLACLAVSPTLGAALSFTESASFDLTGVIVEGCGELVELSGSVHDTFHVTERANGSHTFVISTNPTGLLATGLTTGSIYRATGATHQTIVGGAPDETTLPEWGAVTYIDRTRLVGTAGALTLEIWLTFHFTKLDHINVIFFERAKATCS